jgi:hypothetical protein
MVCNSTAWETAYKIFTYLLRSSSEQTKGLSRVFPLKRAMSVLSNQIYICFKGSNIPRGYERDASHVQDHVDSAPPKRLALSGNLMECAQITLPVHFALNLVGGTHNTILSLPDTSTESEIKFSKTPEDLDEDAKHLMIWLDTEASILNKDQRYRLLGQLRGLQVIGWSAFARHACA